MDERQAETTLLEIRTDVRSVRDSVATLTGEVAAVKSSLQGDLSGGPGILARLATAEAQIAAMHKAEAERQRQISAIIGGVVIAVLGAIGSGVMAIILGVR